MAAEDPRNALWVADNLGNKRLTLTQLMMEFQSYELMFNGGKSVQKKPEANLVVGPLSFKGKQKVKGKNKLTKPSVPPHVDRKKAKKSKYPKKIKIFFYNKKENFRSNRK
ncbi:hypothetical protein J1N35_008015, partial [Gossypium stocksii]